jgi:hypothetical protein
VEPVPLAITPAQTGRSRLTTSGLFGSIVRSTRDKRPRRPCAVRPKVVTGG